MKIEIASEKQNALLHRRELAVSVKEYASTPSRKDLLSAIAAQLSVPENTIVIDKVGQDFGSKSASIYVKVYEDEKSKTLYELKYKEERGKPKAEKAEEKKEEKPKEKK